MKRRAILLGLSAAMAAALGSLYRFTDLIVRHYPPSPYDDVFQELENRQEAARLGKVWLSDFHSFNAAKAAEALRNNLRAGSLAFIALNELQEGKLIQIDGWIVPESVALMCALAAKA